MFGIGSSYVGILVVKQNGLPIFFFSYFLALMLNAWLLDALINFQIWNIKYQNSSI